MRVSCLCVVAAIMVVVLPFAGPGWAQESGSAGIEKKLDATASIVFENVTLREALVRLGQEAGLAMEIDEQALSQLPHGAETQLAAVHLEGISYRDALGELFRPFALQFEAGDDRVYVLGSDELMRQPRRLKREELDALVRLKEAMLTASEKDLLVVLEEKTGIAFGLVQRGQMLDTADEKWLKHCWAQKAQSGATVLDTYARLSGHPMTPEIQGTWYVQADEQSGRINIIILSTTALFEKKLDRRVTIQYDREPVGKVLRELAQKAGLQVEFEPGCLAMLDEDIREGLSLVMRDATIKSAFETLSATTGLKYELDKTGIKIAASDNLRAMSIARAEPTRTYNPVVCTIITDLGDTGLESMILVRQDELAEQGLLEKYLRVRKDSIQNFMQFLSDYPEPTEQEDKK